MSQIQTKYITRLLLLLCLVFVPFSCSNKEEPRPEIHEEEHTVQLLFSAAPPAYADSDDASEAKITRAATADWPNGARLYLRFGKNGATGTATYDASTRQWELSFTGSLTADEDATCEVWYFENPLSASVTYVTISPYTAIFKTKSATYIYHNNVVHLRASLEPTEARLRFKGTPGTTLGITDWQHFSAFSRSSGTLSTITDSVSATYKLTVGSDGYTPYIYGHNDIYMDIQMLHLDIAGSPYYRPISDFDFQPGGSYSTAMPTESLVSDGKWSHIANRERTFSMIGHGQTVTFTMIGVEGGTFQMGRDDDVYYGEHTVTLTNEYYMGKTEVTQALWYAVMGQSPTSNGSQWNSSYGHGDDYPAYYVSYEDCQSFLSELNSMLSSQLSSGEEFRFPTEAEWEFAARGGNKSRGYTYSGSNIIDEVAWYKSNSSNTNHIVKTKAANELGLFDMSGNVWEWCYDKYGSYNNGAQTNPTGSTSGSFRVYRGGGLGNDAESCRVANRGYITPPARYSFLGLRLCLGAPIGQ